MKMIFGGIYQRKKGYDTHNDQHYYYYIPVAYKNDDGSVKYKMVDTYVIHDPCYGDNSYAKHLWFLEQANCGETSWKIFNDHWDYYYKNYYNINSDELDENAWEFIADLHDYKAVSDDDANNYLNEDVLRFIPLWNEDCYRWGSGIVGRCYVKKDAKIDGTNYYNNIKSNNTFGFDTWEPNNLIKLSTEILNGDYALKRGMKKKIKNNIKIAKKYIKLAKDFEDFKENLK